MSYFLFLSPCEDPPHYSGHPTCACTFLGRLFRFFQVRTHIQIGQGWWFCRRGLREDLRKACFLALLLVRQPARLRVDSLFFNSVVDLGPSLLNLTTHRALPLLQVPLLSSSCQIEVFRPFEGFCTLPLKQDVSIVSHSLSYVVDSRSAEVPSFLVDGRSVQPSNGPDTLLSVAPLSPLRRVLSRLRPFTSSYRLDRDLPP